MPRRKNLPNGAVELTFRVDAPAKPAPDRSGHTAAPGPVIEAAPGCDYRPNPAPQEPLPLASADPPACQKNTRNTHRTATVQKAKDNPRHHRHRYQSDPALLELPPDTVVASHCATHSTSVQVDAAPLPTSQAQSPIADEAFNPFLQPTLALDPPSSPSISVQFWSLASPSPSPRARHQPQDSHHSIVQSPRPLPTCPVGNKQCHAATDVWTFYEGGPKQNVCLFCIRQIELGVRKNAKGYSLKTGTDVLRRHLYEEHSDSWIEGCDRLRIPITAKSAQRAVTEYRNRKGQCTSHQSPDSKVIRPFSQEAFVDAIVDFIVADDQSINVIENPQLRAIFLMLREDLQDEHIPHRMTVRNQILQVWDEHLVTLSTEMKGSLGKISFTSDMWTDSNLTPFMAVTAHWIESSTRQTPEGPQHILKLRADLIGFRRVPGRHDGEHLAHAFLHVLDQLSIASKIGWITLDNASNNNSMMRHLKQLLSKRDILFDDVLHRIRCFPHVVNLACKAILKAITDMDFATENANEFVPDGPSATTFVDAIDQDPIATIRSVIRAIRVSSLRRQYFSAILKKLEEKDLQLLRDVDTRWSSTLLMIERAIHLQLAIDKFLASSDMADLRKFQLSSAEWDALAVFKKILAVLHAFQQRLSSENTPTLCDAIPAFEAMSIIWKKQQDDDPQTLTIIQAGLDKLEEYRNRADLTPAYILAMIVNPAMKLEWFRKHQPDDLEWAKQLFIRELRPYRQSNIHTPAPTRSTTMSDATWANDILGLGTHVTSAGRSLAAEVDAYLLDSRIGTSCLSYWQENQRCYPTIFLLAMDIIPIQGSAVPCERVFSSAKETMTARRSRISSELMEALQVLKFSIRKGQSLTFTAGTSRFEELNELEVLNTEEALIPVDIMAFIESLNVSDISDDLL